MRYTPPPEATPRPRPGSRKVGLALAALALAAGACSGGHPRSSGPTTTLLTRDRWTPPALTGGPSTQNFCTAVVAVYRHMAQLPSATTSVKEQILGDYVSEAPTMVAEAPPAVAADARLYIPGVAVILGDLQNAGLNGKKITDSRIAELLLDPKVKAAGSNVIAFVQANCNYTIGS